MKTSLQLLLNPLPTTDTFCSYYPCSISFHLPQKNICRLFLPQIFSISLNSYNIPSSLLLDTLINKDCQYSDKTANLRMRNLINVIWIDCLIWKKIMQCVRGAFERKKSSHTAHKIKYSIKDFLSKCDQIHRKLRIWSNLLEKSIMENFYFVQWQLSMWKTELYISRRIKPLNMYEVEQNIFNEQKTK